MFFEGERIVAVREMILADDAEGRRAALAKLLPMQREDFKQLFEIMAGLPVTIRLLDPPLHEFLPHTDAELAAVARAMGADPVKLRRRAAAAFRIQPDARLSRRAPRRRLPRDRRHAGARDLRGGDRSELSRPASPRQSRSWRRSSSPGRNSISSRRASRRWRSSSRTRPASGRTITSAR